MNSKEKSLNCEKIIGVDAQLLQIQINKPNNREITKDIAAAELEAKRFTFDGVYDDDSTQKSVYEETAYSLVQSVLEGYNGTIFAYGQTGCGKTFTMEGVRDKPELRGIIPKTFDQIFGAIENNTVARKQFLVRASYIEIYNEDVRDLMSDNPKARCEIKEDPERGVFIKGVTNTEVTTVQQLNILMNEGNKNRSVGATLMNADSSRSHSLFTVTIETAEPQIIQGREEMKIRQGKLNLVDLAGSERQSKTQAVGQRLKEATKINLSLSALGNVIEALVKVANGDKGRHIPYRDSKLTRLLQDSLGGNTKTVMIAAISPADYNYEETLSTLRYANRAKNIKNKPKINEDPKDAMLREYQDEIKRLKQLLEERGLGDLIAQAAAAGAKGLLKAAAPFSALRKAAAAAESPEISGNKGESGESVENVVLSSAEKARLAEEQAEYAEDMARLGEQKQKHEQMAVLLSEQMKLDLNSQGNIGSQQVLELQEHLQAQVGEHEAKAKELAVEMEQKLEAEKAKLHSIQEKSRNQQESLKNKLAKLQQKLLSGSQKVKDLRLEQEEKVRQAKEKEMEFKQQQAKLLEEKLRAEEEKLLLEEEYSSVKEEITGKSKKLKALQRKYAALVDDSKENESNWENEKEGYLNNIRDIYRELRLYKLICENFLTNADIDKIVKNSFFNEEKDAWQLPKIELPIIFPTIKVNSALSLSAAGSNNIANRRSSVSSASAARGASATVNSDPNGADAGWKKSVVAAIDENKRVSSGSGRQQSFDRGQSAARVVEQARLELNRAASGHKTSNSGSGFANSLSVTDQELVTSGVKRRSVFEPLSSSQSAALQQESKENEIEGENFLTSTHSIPRKASFNPGAAQLISSGSTQGNNGSNSLDINAIDAGLKKRAHFEPASHTLQPNHGQAAPPADSLAVTASLPPRRPAFQPGAAHLTASSATANQGHSGEIDEILARAPKARGSFVPAAASLISTEQGEDFITKTNGLHIKSKFEPAKLR
jgi:hypothetical protein